MTFFESIRDEQIQFIDRQEMFFVATAPLSAEARINLSPKGIDSFRVISPQRVAYLDLTGSGNETSAHVAENGRITVMFCAFAGKPLILRLYGKGRTVLPDDPRWQEYEGQFPDLVGVRQVIEIDVDSVQTSCGFSVPLYEFRGQRDLLLQWSEKKGPEGLTRYQQEKNARSIDGLRAPLAED